MIRALVVEDQTLVRQGICSLLSLTDDIEVVGESTDGAEALAAIERLHPDVVLLDVRMPRVDGLEVLRCLREKGASVPVLVLTTFDDDEALFEALRAGAKGYLLKEVSLDQLASAIRVLAEGGDLIHPALSSRAAQAIASGVTSWIASVRSSASSKTI